MAVEEKGHVCQAGDTRKEIWELACPLFPGSAACCALSPLCKCMWDRRLGSRTHAEKHPLSAFPYSSSMFSCSDRSPGEGEEELEQRQQRWLLVKG